VNLQAFHNDAKIKAKYVKRVEAHRKADELVRGIGWENGRGCAVGCTLENYDHSRYPIEIGLPEWLARLEDYLFENLPQKEAMTWPERFLKAIPVGANVENVQHNLAIRRLDRLIVSQTKALSQNKGDLAKGIAAVIASIETVKALHHAQVDGKMCPTDAARSAARSAAESAAWSAARSAAESAAWSAAWSAARSAAESAAWSAAESAAWSAARSAAESAAWSAAESAAWSAARSAARSAAIKQEASDLIELLKACK
jgi:hypothetical protein